MQRQRRGDEENPFINGDAPPTYGAAVADAEVVSELRRELNELRQEVREQRDRPAAPAPRPQAEPAPAANRGSLFGPKTCFIGAAYGASAATLFTSTKLPYDPNAEPGTQAIAVFTSLVAGFTGAAAVMLLLYLFDKILRLSCCARQPEQRRPAPGR